MIFCLRLWLVDYGYEAFTSTIFCFGSGLLKSRLSSLLKSLGRGSIFSWKNEEGTLTQWHSHKWAGYGGTASSCQRLNEPDKSVPCLEKEEKAIPLFNIDKSQCIQGCGYGTQVWGYVQNSSVIGYTKIRLWQIMGRIVQMESWDNPHLCLREGKLSKRGHSV